MNAFSYSLNCPTFAGPRHQKLKLKKTNRHRYLICFMTLWMWAFATQSALAIPPGDVLVFTGKLFAMPLVVWSTIFIFLFRFVYIRLGIDRFWQRPKVKITVFIIMSIGIGLSAGHLSNNPQYFFRPPPSTISMEELQEAMSAPPRPILIDRRGPKQFASWHLPGSINLTEKSETETMVSVELNSSPTREFVIICYAGFTSDALTRKILERLKGQGSVQYSGSVRYLDGGYFTLRAREKEYRLRGVRNVPAEMADLWVNAGEAILHEITAETFQQDPGLSKLKDKLRSATVPVVIRLLHVKADDVELRLKDYALKDHVYVPDDNTPLYSPSILLAHLGVFLKQLAGGAWEGLMLIFLLQMILMVFVRKRTIFLALTQQEKWWKWIEIVIPLGSLLIISGASNGNYEFYYRSFLTSFSSLPSFAAYFILLYLTLMLGLWIQLCNPPEIRRRILLNILHAASQGKRIPFQINLGWSSAPFWTIVIIFLLVLFPINLPTILFSIGGLFWAFLIDMTLAEWFFYRLGHAKHPEKILLRWTGISLKTASGVRRLFTAAPDYPNRLFVKMETESFYLGPFSGRVIPHGREPTKLRQENENREIITLGNRVRSILGREVVITWDSRGDLTELKMLSEPWLPPLFLSQGLHLYGNNPDRDDQNRIRFDALPFDEAVDTPTPLTLEVLKKRWDKKGGAIRALQSMGIQPKSQNIPGQHMILVGSHLYKDLESEKVLFRTGRFGEWIRKTLVPISVRLAIETSEEQFLSRIMPRAHQRMKHLKRKIHARGMGRRSLVKIVLKALARLSGKAAFWQERMAFAHHQITLQLEQELKKAHLKFSDLPVQPESHASLPFVGGFETSAYELYRPTMLKTTKIIKPSVNLPAPIQNLWGKWKTAETLRQRARDLFLREQSLVIELLHQLGEEVGLGGDVVFLSQQEIRSLSRRDVTKDFHLEIEKRKALWLKQKEISLPERLSIIDVENISSRKREPSDHSTRSRVPSMGVRVSGPNHPVNGVVRVVKTPGSLAGINRHHVMVTSRLEPIFITTLKHIRGIIVEQGGLLSHAAIIAREMGIPAIMGVSGATETFHDGDRIQLREDGTIRPTPPGTELWNYLDQAGLAQEVGMKAKRLGQMIQNGFSVPTGAVLTCKAFAKACKHWNAELPQYGEIPPSIPMGLSTRDLPKNVLDTLEEILEAIAIPLDGLIVRSSASQEDRPDRSFAGLYRSQAGVYDREALIDAVCRCWESAWDKDVLNYGEIFARGQSVSMNLIVQHYVQGSVGGVLFTRDPLNGDESVYVIETAEGGAEPAANGSLIKNRLTVSRSGDIRDQTGGEVILTGDEIVRLCDISHDLKRLFKAHLDIEWVIAHDELRILQARDI